MDLSKLLEDAKARADVNGDGKLTVQDLEALRDQHGLDSKLVDDLKAKADASGDGKLGFDDIKAGAANLGEAMNNFKDKFFGDKK